MRLLKPLLGLVLTCVFLYLASRHVDPAQVGQAFSSLTWQAILISLLWLILDFVLKTVRWWWLLRALAPGLPLTACGWPLLVGFALNNILPLRAGDIARAFGFRQQLQAPAARILGSLIVERLFDLFVLLLFLLIGLAVLDTATFPPRLLLLARWASYAGLAAVALLVLAPSVLREVTSALLDWLVHNTRIDGFGRLRVPLEQLFDALAVVASTRVAVPVLLISILAWLFESALFATIASDLQSPLGVTGSLFVTGAGTLSTLIPSSPGYIGTFDYFTMQAAIANGMTTAHAPVFAVIVHLLLWAPITLVGALYFIRPDARAWWRATRSAAGAQLS